MPLLLGGASTLVVHCDYDAQAVVRWGGGLRGGNVQDRAVLYHVWHYVCVVWCQGVSCPFRAWVGWVVVCE